MTLKSNYKQSNYKHKNDEDEDDDDEYFSNRQLAFFKRTQEITNLSIPIDEGVREPKYYRQAVQAISNTSEGDIVEFEINSGGGRLDGLLAILTAMQKTDALTVANINGECHSAASMLALNCDNVYVSPYATMLCHHVSYGTAGKASDIKLHVNHIQSVCEKLFRQTYHLFLTEDEIESCLEGYQLWLDSDEINRRLEQKYSVINALIEAEQESAKQVKEPDKPKVKRKSKAK
jgi:ATP-dependent protease ClpP protease subunit